MDLASFEDVRRLEQVLGPRRLAEAMPPARTIRHPVRSLVTFNMFFHVEHHLFPQIPTAHLPVLARRLELPVVEMMLHSSELLPGGSESFFDEASIEKLFVMVEGTLATLRDHGVRGVTLGEYRRAYSTASSEAPAASLRSVPA